MSCIVHFKGKQVVTIRLFRGVLWGFGDRRVSYRGQGQENRLSCSPCVVLWKRSYSLYVRNVSARNVSWLSLGKCSSLFVSFSVWFYGCNLDIVIWNHKWKNYI